MDTKVHKNLRLEGILTAPADQDCIWGEVEKAKEEEGYKATALIVDKSGWPCEAKITTPVSFFWGVCRRVQL